MEAWLFMTEKTIRKFWRQQQVVRGGAIAATGAAFLGGFIGDVTEQIANLITDSKQDLDYNSMLVSSVTGSVFGKVGDTFESTIKKASSNMMNSIDTKYRSSKFQKTIKEEIKREVSTTGQRIGNASRKQINSKTNERIKALKKNLMKRLLKVLRML